MDIDLHIARRYDPTQTPLLPWCATRHNGTRTSIAAARDAAPTAGTQAARVLEYVRDAGEHGRTRCEIARALGMKEGAVCARVSVLMSDGWLHEDGSERASDVGKAVKVLKATRKTTGDSQ